MKLTTQQNNAVVTHGKTLLVSAGAGSGKTTVLTQRLIDSIKKGNEVTDFLVVTFMKAAAADIKEKLYKALINESALNPDNMHLHRQIMLVSEANICTISSYCLGLVKENFALLGISPRVRVVDETEAAMMLRRVTEDLIKKGYDSEDENFLLLADNFSGEKSDDKLVDKMISLYNTLSVTLDRESMLCSCAETLVNDAEITKNLGFFNSNNGNDVKTRLVGFYDELLSSANDIYEYASSYADDKYMARLSELVEICENVRISLEENYVNYCQAALNSRKTPKLYSSGCDTDVHERVKTVKSDIAETLKALEEKYCCGSENLIAESFLQCAKIVLAVNSFLNDMDSEYKNIKLESNALDYTDFELLALELLETSDENGNKVPTDLCLKKRSKFKEILIDEYQDVNPLQDKLFTLLSGGSHRFMVGDVKQSIYRFRNAYPDIFLGYKAKYPDLDNAQNSDCAKIFLRENFRCSPTVINYVNHLFQNITENTPFRNEYDGEWLVYPYTEEETANKRIFPVVVAVGEKEKGKSKEARRNEAEYIASEILRLKHQETDSQGNAYKFSDFAIMMGAMKGYAIEYEKAFKKFGIPYKTAVSENFLENPVIRLAVSALKTVDDPTDDISLCALMRSPVFNFTSQDLYRIRLVQKGTSFYNALLDCASPKCKKSSNAKFSYTKKIATPCLTVRCRRFITKLLSWRESSIGTPCSDFLKNFLVSSGLLRISADGSRQSLLLLFEYASRYETAQSYGLSGFLDYLSELSSSGKEIADIAGTGDEDSVSFITVHKSKGLEYKVCFLACTDKEFRGLKSSSDIIFRRGEGIYFKLRNRTRLTTYNPICNAVAFDKEKDLIRGEELRKLYVALTRAKERLYVTGCISADKVDEKYTPLNAKSWLELVLYAKNQGEKDFVDFVTIDDAKGKSGYIPPEKRKTVTPTPDMLNAVNFSYPFNDAVKTAAKISVSELREGLLEDDEYNRTHLSVPSSRVALKPDFIEKSQSGAAEIGTANHLFMQFCDFALAEQDVETEALRLLNNGMFTKEQFSMMDFNALAAFFKGELYKKIKNSPKVYREKRFSVRDKLGDNSEPLLVQGVIDCFFLNSDGTYTIVDYKTDRVKTYQELIARHKVQLACYKRAVEGMTKSKVSCVLLYSFALGGSAEVL